MKKLIIILVGLVFLSLFIISCQSERLDTEKAKEPEGKESLTQKKEVKQQPLETRPDVKPKQKEKPPTTPEVKEEKKETKPSPLTEEERKILEKAPLRLTEEEALVRLKILLEGDHNSMKYKGKVFSDERLRRHAYESGFYDTMRRLVHLRSSEGYDLLIKVMREKKDYPGVRAYAAEFICFFGEFKNGKWHADKKAIPVLKELLHETDSVIRLQVAGSLLCLEEGDIALPVLDELAKAGIRQSKKALYKLFTFEEYTDGKKRIIVSPTKLWDERGKEMLIRALKYPTNEVKAFAARSLARMRERELAEPVLLDILKRLKDMQLKDYGLTKEDYKKYGEGGKEEAYQQYLSDSRALGTTVSILGYELKSKKAIPFLKDVVNNPEASYLKDRAIEALENLENIEAE